MFFNRPLEKDIHEEAIKSVGGVVDYTLYKEFKERNKLTNEDIAAPTYITPKKAKNEFTSSSKAMASVNEDIAEEINDIKSSIRDLKKDIRDEMRSIKDLIRGGGGKS